MIDFATPLALLALPLPILVWLWAPTKQVAGPYLTVPFDIAARSRTLQMADRLRGLAVPGLAWCLMIIAIAEPRQLSHSDALPISGRDLIVSLDLSGSMIREDFELDGKVDSRLNIVKSIGSDFVRRRSGDRIALMVFGSDPYFATPFSYDVASVAEKIEEAVIGISGRATNISGAMGLALKRFEHSDAATKVLILLSDGENTAGNTSPLAVARLASELGVRVHTIAMGVKDKASAPDEQGVVDARLLQNIAEISGGESFRVRTTDDLEKAVASLDRLERTDRAGLPAELYRSLWIIPASLAALLMIGMLWWGKR